MLQWGDLFTARQKVALVHLARDQRRRALEADAAGARWPCARSSSQTRQCVCAAGSRSRDDVRDTCSDGRRCQWCGTLPRRATSRSQRATSTALSSWIARGHRELARVCERRASRSSPTRREHPLPDESAARLVHRPAVLRRHPVRRSLGLLLRLAEARAAGSSAAARSLRPDEPAHAEGTRGCSGRDARASTGAPKDRGVLRGRRWRRRSPRAGASCARTASAASSSPTRRPRAGRRCSRA